MFAHTGNLAPVVRAHIHTAGTDTVKMMREEGRKNE